MRHSDASVRRFVDAWEKDFGERLSPDVAALRLTQLAELYLVICRPLRSDVGGVGDEEDTSTSSAEQVSDAPTCSCAHTTLECAACAPGPPRSLD
jgi:hypothetical protein